MKQYLEQRLYAPTQESKENFRVYQVGDLESLSASVLYSKIKKGNYIKSNDKELNLYNLINLQNFGETEVGLQKKGESHKDFKKRIVKSGGYRIVPTINRGGSY